MLDELIAKQAEQLVNAKKKIKCLTREKLATEEAHDQEVNGLATEIETLWSHNKWLNKQSMAKEETVGKHREQLRHLQAENAKLEIKTAESAKKCAENKQLKTQIINLRNMHDAKQWELIRKGVQINEIEKEKTLAATKHQKDMKTLRHKAVTWRRIGML